MSASDVERVVNCEHSDPHCVLGAHPVEVDGKKGAIIRAFHPHAVSAAVTFDGRKVEMKASEETGLFWIFLADLQLPVKYLVTYRFTDDVELRPTPHTDSCPPWETRTCIFSGKASITISMR